MILQNPIFIEIKSFILDGTFDCIKLDQSKGLILNNFPDPDCKEYKESIWQYGALEFHFNKDTLYTIWCDNLSNLCACKSLRIEPWFLCGPSELSLEYVLSRLNKEHTNYSIMFDEKLGNAVIKIRKSRVTLWFENMENWEVRTDPNTQYSLAGIGLTSKEYDIFDKNF